MEARTACRRSAIFKNMVAIIAAIVAVFMVGATGGYLVKTLSLPVAAPSAPVVSAQSVMSDGSASNDRTGRSGTTNVEGPARDASSTGASFREPGSSRGGPQS